MHLFIDTSRTGEPFNTSTASNFFQKLLRRLGAPPGKSLNPHSLRHVFIGHRRAQGAGAPGPDQDGAALLMGHSPKQWDYYDSQHSDRVIAQALQAMPAWRASLAAAALPPPLVLRLEAPVAPVQTNSVVQEEADAFYSCSSDSSSGEEAEDFCITVD